MANKLLVVSIEKLLCLAGDELSLVGQWRECIDKDWSNSVTEALNKAEVLINTVEEFDCGSHGGFGKGQPADQTIFERWQWLCNKYGVDYDEVKNYGWPVKELKKLFTRKD